MMLMNKNKKCRHRIDTLVAYTLNKDFMGTHEEGRHLQDEEAEASEETRFFKYLLKQEVSLLNLKNMSVI